MKKVLILSLGVCLGLFGCKKNSTDEPKTDIVPQSEEIIIGSNPSLVFSKGALATDFVAGSKIGVYSVERNHSTGETDISKQRQSNVGYAYDTDRNIWSVLSGIKPLQWQFDGSLPAPIQLIAYSPYSATNAVEADNLHIPFELLSTQNTNEEVQVNDLMWARSTGQIGAVAGDYEKVKPAQDPVLGRGIQSTIDKGKAIELEFNHVLSNVKMYVSFVKKPEGAETIENVKLTSIEVHGPKISRFGKLNMLTGVYAPTANAADVTGMVKWDTGLDITTVPDTEPADWKTNKAHYTHICDFVVQPQAFDKTATVKDVIEFHISYTYNSGLVGDVDETVKKSYRYILGDTSLAEFAVNTSHNVYAYMVLSSNEIRVTTSIVPWVSQDHFIPAE